MLAWAAFTSDDFPMPRAPQSSALLAGSPLANRSVFSIRMSRIRSMPLSRVSATRLTRATLVSRPFGCQTKASASAKEQGASGTAALAERCAAIASSAAAILAALSSLVTVAGRFATGFADFCAIAFRAGADALFRVFFDIGGFPDRAAFNEPFQGPQAGPNEGASGVAIGTATAIVRANLIEPAPLSRPCRLVAVPQRIARC